MQHDRLNFLLCHSSLLRTCRTWEFLSHQHSWELNELWIKSSRSTSHIHPMLYILPWWWRTKFVIVSWKIVPLITLKPRVRQRRMIAEEIQFSFFFSARLMTKCFAFLDDPLKTRLPFKWQQRHTRNSIYKPSWVLIIKKRILMIAFDATDAWMI